MPDLTAWAPVDAFTIEQAACLWAGVSPSTNSFTRTSTEKDLIAAKLQMLTAAIQLRVLDVDASANVFAPHNHSTTMATREALRAFAESKNEQPAFLYDTLLPSGVKHGEDAPTPRENVRSQGGRPPEYDWDAFTIEIIRIADGLDGLPEKQADLIKTMLQWFEAMWGKQPAESSVKSRISRIYNGLGKGKN